MARVTTFQSGALVSCYVLGFVLGVKAATQAAVDPNEELPSNWLEAYGKRHQARYAIESHLTAVESIAQRFGLGDVNPEPIDSTATGYVFTTTSNTTKEKIMTEKNTDETVTAKAPKVKREPIPEGAIVDNKEISQELVNGWIDSYRTKGEDNSRMDWTGIVDAVKENHDVQLPNDNRHPVSTKVQRCFRAIVLNDMEPVPAKPKKEKPAPEPEETEAEVEA